MKKIGFWFIKAWAWMVALTPFCLLYVRSDIYYFLVYHVAHYRRKVVRDNLVKSFPEKSVQEIVTVERRFYHNLCDLIVEICKLLKMKPDELAEHVEFDNPEIIQQFYAEGRSVFAAMPHSGNWEWFGKLMHTVSDHKSSAIYKKVKDPNFEAFMLEIRTNYNLDQEQMIEAATALKALVRRRSLLNDILIIADQSPRGVETDYWTDFLHRDTCWFTGLEKMARLLDYAVVFVEMTRTRRGYYKVHFTTLCADPKSAAEGSIMESYVRNLESFIKQQPDNWLWSHRRWKHKRQEKA